MTEAPSDAERTIDSFLRHSQFTDPADIPDLVARHARAIGASDAVIYVADLQQMRLLPVSGRSVPAREPLVIGRTVAGWAFRTLTVLDVAADGGWRRVWLPLLDAMHRLGVLEMIVESLDADTARRCRILASLTAGLIISKRAYSDMLVRLARTRDMTLAAELQNALLPPSTVGTERVTVSGVVEPAYEVGGDVYDVALDGDDAYVAVLDAVGHDLQAGLVSSVAVGGFRNSRRSGKLLRDTVAAVDEGVKYAFDTDRFATAVLAHVDVGTGMLSWLNCGHPPPVLLRGGKMVKILGEPSGLPLGLGYGLPETGYESLEPGDRVLLYTDGVVEARTPEGEPFGEERLIDFVIRQGAAGMLLPETLRRIIHAILERQAGLLQDDATVLVIEWLGEGAR